MNDFPLDEPRYSRILAAQLANISLELLERCETERLIEVRIIQGGQPGYSASDIRHLALIHRMHEVLGVDMQDLEVVLHLRNQLLALQEQMQEMERQWLAREEKLLDEMLDLRRRLADDADWE
jgi:MerR family transcriptional regulator/heat shock protein HspR